MKIKHISYIFFSLIFFYSCSLKKNNIGKDNSEKNYMTYIALFHEAGKNRLKGNLKEAEEQYISALNFNKKSAVSYFYLASIKIKQKNYNQALIFSRKATELQPENYWYKLENADILYITGNTKKAEEIYNRLIKQNPKNEIPYLQLENIYKKEKNYEKLITLYKTKQKNYEYSEKTDIELFNLFLKTNNYKDAENTIKKLIEKFPEEIKYKGMAAEYYYSVNKPLKAEKIYDELIKKYPDNTEINLSYALFCQKNGKKEEFFNVTKKLINSDLDFIKKTRLLISGRFPNFPPDKYEILLDELYENHPDELLANTLKAEFYLNKNDEKNALPYIEKSLEINPSDFNMATILFGMLYDLKKFEKLKKLTGKYLEYFPNQSKIYLYKGISEYELKNFKTAKQTLNYGKTLVIENNELENQFLYYISLIYKKEKNFKESYKLTEKLTNDKNIKINEHIGDLMFALNKKNEALKYWKKALENGNKSKNLLYKINNFDKITEDDIIK